MKNDYYASKFCSMLYKGHNVILAAFKFYIVEQRHLQPLFLPFTVNKVSF